MSDHSHYRTLRESKAALPGLLIAFILEAPGLIFGHQLAITAHLIDIFSDIIAFGSVIIAARVSGRLDDKGREHSDDEPHGEQVFVACINVLTLLLGGATVMIISIGSFGREVETVSWQDSWWLVPGPIASLGVYSWLRDKVKQIEAKDITTAGLEQHVRGDVLIARLVVLSTVLNMATETNWINPAGGIVMSLILILLGLGYLVKVIQTVRVRHKWA